MKNHNINKIWHTLATPTPTKKFTEELIAELPAPVQRYFSHAITPGTPLATGVKLTMEGKFRASPDKWLTMQGEEILTAKGFVWKALIGSGLFHLKGADYYYNGAGKVEFKIWGLIPFVKAINTDTTRSSIARCGGELFWLPSALLPQQGVSWQAINDDTIQASFQIDGEPVNLTLLIDENGKVLQAKLPRWGNQTTDKTWSYLPFGGKLSAETTFDGLTIPSEIAAGWYVETDSYYEFFQATIKQAEFF
ncbi:DUF6920 family protein [Richelia sinica]|nr:DUF6544 family protein [Richelia sinica]